MSYRTSKVAKTLTINSEGRQEDGTALRVFRDFKYDKYLGWGAVGPIDGDLWLTLPIFKSEISIPEAEVYAENRTRSFLIALQ